MRLANLNEAHHAAVGYYRAPCPECDRGTKDDALGVTVETYGRYVWHCFRCGASGNALDLWAVLKRLGIYEAVLDLYRRLGREVPRKETTMPEP